MQFNKHNSYKISYQLSNLIWKIVKNWDYLDQSTLGKQLIRSADSISSNIAEGWNRYYKKDKIRFYSIAKSSFFETLDHINKGIKRGLIDKEKSNIIKELISQFPKEINGLIKGTNDNLKE